MLRFQGFKVVFPCDIGSDPSSTRGVGIDPDEVAPLPAAAMKGEAVEPADDDTPVSGVAVGCPTEAIAIQETRYFNIWEAGWHVGTGWREVQLGERSKTIERMLTNGVYIGGEELAV